MTDISRLKVPASIEADEDLGIARIVFAETTIILRGQEAMSVIAHMKMVARRTRAKIARALDDIDPALLKPESQP